MAGDIRPVSVLANRVTEGSQWLATHRYWQIVLLKDRRGGRHPVLANRVSERQPRRATSIGLERAPN